MLPSHPAEVLKMIVGGNFQSRSLLDDEAHWDESPMVKGTPLVNTIKLLVVLPLLKFPVLYLEPKAVCCFV